MASEKIPSAGGCSLLKRRKKSGALTLFYFRSQPFEFVFHSIVEKPVDNYVDNADKPAMVRLLDLIA
jgi:hypothetical protein